MSSSAAADAAPPPGTPAEGGANRTDPGNPPQESHPSVEPGDEVAAPEPSGDADNESRAEPDADSPAGREAAKYRTQRNEARQEADRLRTQVEDYQRRAVEAAVGLRMHAPSDLWNAVDLADVLDADGRVDQARLDRALADIAAKKPHWFRSNAAPASEVGHDGKRPPGQDNSPSWQGLFQRASGRGDAD